MAGTFLNAEKSAGGHVNFFNFVVFNRITFYLAVRCKRFLINKSVKFELKFQTVTEKTAKNFRGLFFCSTLYTIQGLVIICEQTAY